jgi:LAO/AO transport system kinase
MDELVEQIRQGDRRALAQAMTLVESGRTGAKALKERLRQATGEVPWWGFTGPPGVGKSTLIDGLIMLLRRRGLRIGIVAVDPSSPVSHGALLGDRVRMMRHAVDRNVFIRSLATRGREGGLSDAALHCARFLELACFDPVLIETVGVGQNELDVASIADVCVVVLGPGYGDDIQLAKAGLLEIADVVVVNKCDLPEADRLLQEVHGVLAGLAAPTRTPAEAGSRESAEPGTKRDEGGTGTADTHRPRILGVEARSQAGVDLLLDVLIEVDQAARAPGLRREHRDRRILAEVDRSVRKRFEDSLARTLSDPASRELVDRLIRGECSLDAALAKFTEETVAGLES